MKAHAPEDRNEFFSPFAFLDAPEQVPDEWECLATRRAPAAGFPDEKVHKIKSGIDQTGLLIKNDYSTGAQPIAGLFPTVVIQFSIQEFFGQVVSGCPAGQASLKFASWHHSPAMLLNDFPQTYPHREFVTARTGYLSAHTIEFCARSSLGGGQILEPFSPVPDDVGYIDQCFDVV